MLTDSIAFTVTTKVIAFAGIGVAFGLLVLLVVALLVFARLGKLLSEIEGLYWRLDDHRATSLASRKELGTIRERLGKVAGMMGPIPDDQDDEEGQADADD